MYSNFWFQRRGWHFVASGTVILFLHVFSDYTGGDDIFCCIRHRYSLLACLFWLHRRGWHFVASGTVILFLHVFSDYTGGDDISLHPAPLFSSCMSFLTTQEGHFWTFRGIRHRYSLLACLFWLHRRGWHFLLHPAPLFSSCMSFQTTKEGMTFRCIRHRYSLLACLFWLHRRGWHFVASAKRIGRVGCWAQESKTCFSLVILLRE